MSKCTVLSVTTNRNPSTYDYYMDDQHIPQTDNQDYLGITINMKLSWQPHISEVQNKARKTPCLENTACGREHCMWQRTLHVAENTACGREHCMWQRTLHVAENTACDREHCMWQRTLHVAENTARGREHCMWQRTLHVAENTARGREHCTWQRTLHVAENTARGREHCTWQRTLHVTENTACGREHCTWQRTLHVAENTARGREHCTWQRTLHVAENTARDREHCMWQRTLRCLSDRCLSVLLAPGHPTARQTFRKLNKCSNPRLVLSLVTIGELKCHCANLMYNTLHARHCIRDANLFYKIHHGQVRISLPTLSQQTLTLVTPTSINSEHYQPPASSTSTHSLTQEADIVTADTHTSHPHEYKP